MLLVKWIDWLDLPKLTSLRTRNSSGWTSYTFRSPRHITLESDSHPLWMMFRHAQSLQCVSSWCIRLHEWHHSPRKYSLHPSLTNRHRSSCKSSKSAIEARDSTLCFTHHSSSFESPSYQCNQPHNDHSHFKRNQCLQNRWNNPSRSFSKTTWNPCISHSVIANSSFYKSRNRCGLSFLHSRCYRAVCLSESHFKGHSR